MRTSLPARVEPGETALVPVHLDPPGPPGRHELAIDLVHEHVGWFERPLRLSVEVVAGASPLCSATANRSTRTLAARLDPEVEPVVLTWNDEPRRYRPTSIEALGPYLFGERGLDRISALARAAAVMLGGDRAGDASVAAVRERFGRAEALVIAGDGERPGAPPRRERLNVLTTSLIAKRLGVPVFRVRAGEPWTLPGSLEETAPGATVVTPAPGSTMRPPGKGNRFVPPGQAEERSSSVREIH